MALFSGSVEHTLSERLPFFNFDPSTEALWLKDGSATMTLKVSPMTTEHFTDSQLQSLRFGITSALGQMPEGAMLQALLVRERTTSKSDEAYLRWVKTHSGDSNTPERDALFCQRIAQLEKEFSTGGVFQNRCYLSIRILPTAGEDSGRLLGALSFIASRIERRSTSRLSRTGIMDQLLSVTDHLLANLEACGFQTERTNTEERLQVIYEWLNPERSKEVSAPNASTAPLAETVALTDLIETRKGLALGRTPISIITLKTLPELSIPAVVGSFSRTDHPLAAVFTVYVLNQTKERERLLRKQKMAQGMASGNSVRNLMAEAQLRDIEDTLNAMISSGEKLFAASFHLLHDFEVPA